MTRFRTAPHCAHLRPRPPRLAGGLALGALLTVLASGCDRGEPQRQPPPTKPKPGPCQAERKAGDPANTKYVPSKVGGFCLDPTGSDRAFGEGAKASIDDLCQQINGDCELYKEHGVKRVVELRYVDGAGAAATIDLFLSQFGSREQAYAMFTRRVVGDGDPAHANAARPVEAKGVAALGIGAGYLWRGAFLAELTLTDDAASRKTLQSRADRLLPELLRELGDGLPGPETLPAAAAALPSEHRLPLGIRFFTADVLGVKGAGPGAVSYYREGQRRWRLLSIVAGDDEQAADTLATLRKIPGASKDEALGDEAVRFMRQPGPAAPQAEWLVVHSGAAVLGIGDESLVLQEGMSSAEHRERTLSQDDKRGRLRGWLDARRASGSDGGS